MQIIDLDLDSLLLIFSHCNNDDLMNLCRAHWKFNAIIEQNIFYQRTKDLLLCGHRNLPKIQERTQHALTHCDRLHIGLNWIEGRYTERDYFHHAKMFPSFLHLDREWLYITHAGYLRRHKRLNAEPLQRRYHEEIATSMKTDISGFVKKRFTVFAARTCGSCFIYEDGDIHEQRLHSTKEYLRCVDFSGEIYASGSDKCGRLWKRSNEMGLCLLDKIADLKHEYKVLRFNDSGDRLFGGMYTCTNSKALREIDLESGFEAILNSDTIAIYDIKHKDDHVLFTANFDSTFRMFDRRTNRDEQLWADPFDSSFYCLEHDGLYAVLCGAKYHSRVNLYDIRVPGKHAQLYFPHPTTRRRISSPVYSLACDSRYLFVATDHSLKVFDFKVHCASPRDYRNIFCDMWR